MATKKIAHDRGKPLTLANLTLTRTVGDHVKERISGKEIAKLLSAFDPRDGREEFLSSGIITDELLAVADLIGALRPGALSHDDYQLGDALWFIERSLRSLAWRADTAAGLTENRKASWYRVHTGRNGRKRA